MNLFAEFAAYAVGRIGDLFKRPNPIDTTVIPILPEAIARAAEAEIGASESGGSNKGAALAEYFASDSYDPNGSKPGDDGYPWCASFCCFAVKSALDLLGMKDTPGFKRPTTPSAFGFETWSLAQDATTQTKKAPRGDIARGDLVIFKFSHIGVATSGVDKNGHFMCCEGNTNLAGEREGTTVMRKRRHIDQVRSRIRFTV